jgi:hypothetical protein
MVLQGLPGSVGKFEAQETAVNHAAGALGRALDCRVSRSSSHLHPSHAMRPHACPGLAVGVCVCASLYLYSKCTAACLFALRYSAVDGSLYGLGLPFWTATIIETRRVLPFSATSRQRKEVVITWPPSRVEQSRRRRT